MWVPEPVCELEKGNIERWIHDARNCPHGPRGPGLFLPLRAWTAHLPASLAPKQWPKSCFSSVFTMSWAVRSIYSFKLQLPPCLVQWLGWGLVGGLFLPSDVVGAGFVSPEEQPFCCRVTQHSSRGRNPAVCLKALVSPKRPWSLHDHPFMVGRFSRCRTRFAQKLVIWWKMSTAATKGQVDSSLVKLPISQVSWRKNQTWLAWQASSHMKRSAWTT